MYDIIVIGAGPAGLTAAIYGANANKKVLVLEKNIYGGQIVNTNNIKNYPGLYNITGYDYATKLYEQAKDLGAEIKLEEVISITDNEVITTKNKYQTKTIIIATGTSPKMLNLDKEKTLIGNGISFCATCDGMFFKDKIVSVIGGGNTAIDDAIYLSNIAKKIYLIYRKDKFNDSTINKELLKTKDNIEILFNSNIIKITGENKLEEITILNNKTNKEKNIKVDGMFIAIGQNPNTKIFDTLNKDNDYLESNNTTTNKSNIFVAGDVRVKNIRQLTTACSDGTIAAINAINYLNS